MLTFLADTPHESKIKYSEIIVEDFITSNTTTGNSMTEIGNIYEKSVEKATQSQAAVDSNDRMIFFNENYRKRQAEYNLLLFYLLLGFFVFLILVAIKRFFPVIPSSLMNFLIAILFLIILVVIAYKFFDIQRRYILNFDEVDIPNNIALDNDINSKGALSAINQGKLSDLIASGSSAKLFNLPYGYKLDENRNVVLDTDNFRIESSNQNLIPKNILDNSYGTAIGIGSSNCFCSYTYSFPNLIRGDLIGSSKTPIRIQYNTSNKNFNDESNNIYHIIIQRNGMFNLNTFIKNDIKNYTTDVSRNDVITSFVLDVIELCTTNVASGLSNFSPTLYNGNYIYLIKNGTTFSSTTYTINTKIGIIEKPFFILHK